MVSVGKPVQANFRGFGFLVGKASWTNEVSKPADGAGKPLQ